MPKFIEHNIPSCEQINSPSGRMYRTPAGNLYPSVTTVLGSVTGSYIEEWRAKVGEEVANEISRRAATRGTLIHEASEKYLLGEKFKFNMFQRIESDMFKALVPHLDTFEVVHALETRMWSDRLRVAGTVDCIMEREGKTYIVDFKTSGRYKNREEIHSYFHQASAYALMFYERTGIVVDKILILMTTQDDGVLVFEENVKEWLPGFVEIRKNIP